jgi:hypothetical protein
MNTSKDDEDAVEVVPVAPAALSTRSQSMARKLSMQAAQAPSNPKSAQAARTSSSKQASPVDLSKHCSTPSSSSSSKNVPVTVAPVKVRKCLFKTMKNPDPAQCHHLLNDLYDFYYAQEVKSLFSLLSWKAFSLLLCMIGP